MYKFHYVAGKIHLNIWRMEIGVYVPEENARDANKSNKINRRPPFQA